MTEVHGAQGKNLDEFDHVKNDLRLTDAEELAAQQADPMYALNAQGLSEDMKRVMAKLNSADASKARPQSSVPQYTCSVDAPCKGRCVPAGPGSVHAALTGISAHTIEPRLAVP